MWGETWNQQVRWHQSNSAECLFQFFFPGWKQHGISSTWGESFFYSTTPHIGSDLSLLWQVRRLGFSPSATKQSGAFVIINILTRRICSSDFVAIHYEQEILFYTTMLWMPSKPELCFLLCCNDPAQIAQIIKKNHPAPLFKCGMSFYLRVKNEIWWRACNTFIRLWSCWLRPWSVCWPYL